MTKKVQDYDNILEALQRRLHPEASVHIAGGAVRDTILERPIRDIDIFLSNSSSDEAAALLRKDFGYVKVGEWRKYEHFSDPAVVRVAKLEKADETVPLCLIGLLEGLNPYDNIARFDYGICMAAWKGGSTSFITDTQFKRDIESKAFTLCRADNFEQFAYSMVRYKKLTAERYSGWTLSVPDEFAKLAGEYTFRKNLYWNDGEGRWSRRNGESGVHFGFELSPQVLKPKER